METRSLFKVKSCKNETGSVSTLPNYGNLANLAVTGLLTETKPLDISFMQDTDLLEDEEDHLQLSFVHHNQAPKSHNQGSEDKRYCESELKESKKDLEDDSSLRMKSVRTFKIKTTTQLNNSPPLKNSKIEPKITFKQPSEVTNI